METQENTEKENIDENVIESKSNTDNPVINQKNEQTESKPGTEIENKPETSDETKTDINVNDKVTPNTENIHYEGSVAIYTDPSSKYQYQWSSEKNEWEPRSLGDVTSYGYEDDTYTYTDSEGVKYFWDKSKSAWFPKVDDNFLAHYQMSYGFVDNSNKSEVEKTETVDKNSSAPQDSEKKRAEKRKPSEPTWFELDDAQNTKVYVSNLPLDITEQEFIDFMQKCGLIMRDVTTGDMKIKLYTEPNSDHLKGDGLCTYIKVESVNLALNLLDGSDIRGKKIKVERAKFQMKGEAYDPRLKPKKKKKDKEKIKKMQEKLFDWRPEKMRGERSKHEKVVIIKNLFEPNLFDKEVSLLLEYQQDLREECSKCGTVRKIVIHDRNPEGVAQVTMSEPEEADVVVELLNHRWFGQRKITAEIWDGKTKYKIVENETEVNKRLDDWNKYLDTDEKKNENSNKEIPNISQEQVVKQPQQSKDQKHEISTVDQ